MDNDQTRRRFVRWCLLSALHNAQAYGCYEEALLQIVQAIYPDATREETRQCLDYLAKRELITVDKQPNGRWRADIGRHGVDICEYEVTCEPGIARPPKL